MFSAEKQGVVKDATFPSTITPSFQAIPVHLGFRFLYAWTELSEKAGLSLFSSGGGVTNLNVLEENHCVVAEATFSFTITPSLQSSP